MDYCCDNCKYVDECPDEWREESGFYCENYEQKRVPYLAPGTEEKLRNLMTYKWRADQRQKEDRV